MFNHGKALFEQSSTGTHYFTLVLFVIIMKTERYSRRELIGNGAYKTVYKAYDSDEGREVAWNEVKISNVKGPAREKILSEIEILSQLNHDKIMSIYDTWEAEDGKTLVFITEIMSSGTLKDFLGKAKKIKMRNVKKWCRQILEGLQYLHTRDSQLIHRDLKCDNIFMNGNRSEVKIGDLGLSISMKDKKYAVSVIGTPQFMAPELYDEQYTEKIDIYAFGMCVLEMVSGEYPYVECENAAQVYRKVTKNIPPATLAQIQDPTARDLIELCLSKNRPSAEELLNHPFFTSNRNNDTTLYFDNDADGDVDFERINKNPAIPIRSESPNDPKKNVKVVILNKNDSNVIKLKIYLNVLGQYKQIKFSYNTREDTPEEVATDLSKKLQLSKDSRRSIAESISKVLDGDVESPEKEKIAKKRKGSVDSTASKVSDYSDISEVSLPKQKPQVSIDIPSHSPLSLNQDEDFFSTTPNSSGKKEEPHMMSYGLSDEKKESMKMKNAYIETLSHVTNEFNDRIKSLREQISLLESQRDEKIDALKQQYSMYDRSPLSALTTCRQLQKPYPLPPSRESNSLPKPMIRKDFNFDEGKKLKPLHVQPTPDVMLSKKDIPLALSLKSSRAATSEFKAHPDFVGENADALQASLDSLVDTMKNEIRQDIRGPVRQ